jgi:hypothetical protein
VLQIDEVLLGKQSPAFASKHATAALSSRCVTFKGRTSTGSGGDGVTTLDLQADQPELLSAWLFGLNTILDKLGKRVVDLSRAKTQTHRQRYSVVAPADTHPTHPLTPLTELSSIQAVEQGMEAKLHRPNVASEEVWLWYSRQRSELGCIYWAPAVSRNPSPENSVDLSQLSEIFVGKQTAVLQHAALAAVPEEYCFSLITRSGGKVSLQLLQPMDLSVWVDALTSILSDNGKNIVQEGPEENEEEGKQKEHHDTLAHQSARKVLSFRKRFSILARQQKVGTESIPRNIFSHLKPQEAMENMTIKRPTIASLPTTPVVKMMMHGTIFTGYAENRKGKFVKKHLLVFYNPKHGRHGTLYWCPPGTITVTLSHKKCYSLRP